MHLKATLFRKRFSFTHAFFCCPQTLPYSTNQKLSICTSLSVLFSKACLFWAKSFSFVQAFPYRPPKQLFSALHLPCAPSHNLLFAKNTAVFLISALNPYAVTPEPRTDSKPFRRCFVRKAGFGSCCRKIPLKFSPTELWIEVAGRSPACFLCYFLHDAKSDNPFPLRESFKVLRTSKQRTKTTTSHKPN